MLRGAKHHSPGLQNAYNKYKGQLTFCVLELCATAELIDREQFYMDITPLCGLYNAAKTAGSRIGVPASDETKEKIRLTMKGRVFSDETRNLLSQAMKGRYRGRVLTEEHKRKLSAASLGRQKSDTHRQNISAGRVGVYMKNNRSGYCGVSFHKRQGKWNAYRNISGSRVSLGTHLTPECANKARQNFDRVLRFYDSSWTEL